MENRLFKHLLKNEPKTVELTKEEYENCMGIRPKWEPSKEVKAIASTMGEDSAKEDETSFFRGTKKDLIEILKERGFGVGELTRKTKQQLIEML